MGEGGGREGERGERGREMGGERERERETDRQTETKRQTDREGDRGRGRERDRQTDRQTDREREREEEEEEEEEEEDEGDKEERGSGRGGRTRARRMSIVIKNLRLFLWGFPRLLISVLAQSRSGERYKRWRVNQLKARNGSASQPLGQQQASHRSSQWRQRAYLLFVGLSHPSLPASPPPPPRIQAASPLGSKLGSGVVGGGGGG